MGCFLVTTQRDLGQIKSRIKSGQDNHSRFSQSNQVIANTLALYSVSPILGKIYLKSEVGRALYEVGKAGEQIAERVLQQEMAIKITHTTKAQGTDLRGLTRGLSEVAVEVKTSGTEKAFESHLGHGYGYKQCSDGWLKSVGVDPSNTRILGVLIDTQKETVSIYRRVDENAQSWKCLLNNAPLSKYNLG